MAEHDAKKIHRCGRCGDQLAEHGSHLPGLFRCSDGTDTPWAEFRLVDRGVSPAVIRQVAASSFGTPEATALRNSVTDEQVERVMRRVQDRPMADIHLTDDEREKAAQLFRWHARAAGATDEGSTYLSAGILNIERLMETAIAARVAAVLDDLEQARQWISTCVDPLAVGADVKQKMIDTLRERVAKHRGGA